MPSLTSVRFATLAGLFCLAVLSPISTLAQTHPELWERALPSDVDDYEDWAYRQADKNLNLRAFGDFDGDGRRDDAYLTKNASVGRYAVMVKLAKADAAIALDTGALSDLTRIGLGGVKPGPLTGFCARQEPRPDGCTPRVSIPNAAFSVSMFESSERIFYFKNGAWLTVWTSD